MKTENLLFPNPLLFLQHIFSFPTQIILQKDESVFVGKLVPITQAPKEPRQDPFVQKHT